MGTLEVTRYPQVRFVPQQPDTVKTSEFANAEQLHEGLDDAGYDVQASNDDLQWPVNNYGGLLTGALGKPALAIAIYDGTVTANRDVRVNSRGGEDLIN